MVIMLVAAMLLGLAVGGLSVELPTAACNKNGADDTLLMQVHPLQLRSPHTQQGEDFGVGLSLPATSLLQLAKGMLRDIGKPSKASPANIAQLLAEAGVLQGVANNETTHLKDSDKTELSSVKEIIADVLIKNLKGMGAEDQEEVNSDYGDLEDCGSTKSARLGKPAEASLSIVTGSRQSHTSCRQALSTLNTTKASEWSDLNALTDGIPAPPSPIMEYRNTLEHMTLIFDENENSYFKWLTTNAVRFNEAKDEYDKANELVTNKEADCDKKQHTFESAYCAHKANLTTVCSEYAECHRTRAQKFSETGSRVRGSEAQRKEFFKSAKAIVCHLEVILEAGDRSHAECTDLDVNTSAMDIAYPAMLEESRCDRSSVATAPCDAVWLTKEYGGLPENAKNADCSACPTPFQATNAPTDAPTDAPTNAPTDAPTAYSSTVTPASGYARSDTGLIAKELFSGTGVSQAYGPYVPDTDVVFDLSSWGLARGDIITFRTWYPDTMQTERNGQWVQESHSVRIDVNGGNKNGKEHTIQYADDKGVATKIKLTAPSGARYFYTEKGTHALLVNGQPVIDGAPIARA